MNLPDLESLACVDALARTLRFSTAARSRHLSAAAFSKRIQQVEEHVGTRLFSRTTRLVTLTPAGAALLPRIRRLLGEAESLVATGEGSAAIQVTIGTRHELGMSWLMPARRHLAQTMPHLTMHLRFGSTGELEAGVLGLRIDAIVTSHPPSTVRLASCPLGREDYVFVGAPRLLKRNPFVAARDAANHVLIDADDGLPLYGYLQKSGLPLRFGRVVTLGTIDAIRSAVVTGEGVAVLPRYFVADEIKRGSMVPLMPRTRLGHDFFRLVFRADDVHRPVYEEIATQLALLPLS